VDVTAELTTWLAQLPDRAIADLQHGVYRIDSSLKVDGHSMLRIIDGDFRVRAPSVELDEVGRSQRRHLWFTNCADLSLDAISVTGQNTTNDAGAPVDKDGQARYDAAREFEHALALEDCAGVTVTNFSADAIFGDGAYWRRVTNGTFSGFEVSRNGRQGVSVIAGADLTIVNGWIRHSRRSGIDLEPNSSTEIIENVEIAEMTIRSRLISLTAGGSGTVRNISVHDITVNSASTPTLSLASSSGGRRDNWTVERWTTLPLLGSPQPAVNARDAEGLVLRDFTARCDPTRDMSGFQVSRPGAVELTRCTFPGAARLARVIDPTPSYTLAVTDCAPTLVEVV
jgi:hypothetical protein